MLKNQIVWAEDYSQHLRATRLSGKFQLSSERYMSDFAAALSYTPDDIIDDLKDQITRDIEDHILELAEEIKKERTKQ